MVTFYFVLFLLLFTAIGVYSVKKSKNTSKDYLLANSTISPFFSGISAVASTFSGFMFTGFVGYVFVNGLSALWFIIFLFLGEFSSTFFNKFIQEKTKETKALTYIELITNCVGGYDVLRKIIAIIVVVFLGIYASSQILSSTKALHELLDWNPYTGAVIATAIILTYSLSGGVRASIWTDVAQGFVMLISLIALTYFSMKEIGSFNNLYYGLEKIDPNLVSFYPKNLQFGIVAFAIGWFSHGFFGLIGQPHIMNRYMALKNGVKTAQKASYYFIGFSFVLAIFLTIISLAIRVHFKEVSFDQELALLRFSKNIFSDFFLGLILAGLFSSTISTADSQVLVCSSALSRDLFSKYIPKKHKMKANKIATFLVAIFILVIALFGSKNVFSTVLLAWGVLGATLTPFLLLHYFKQKINLKTAITILIVGVSTTVLWHQFGLDKRGIANLLPGIISSFFVYFVFKTANISSPKTNKSVEKITDE